MKEITQKVKHYKSEVENRRENIIKLRELFRSANNQVRVP